MYKISAKKEDPRTVRSKRLLKAAALSLMIESQDLKQLTVKKVAARAELNRATFYLHFLDLQDLLKHIVHDFFDEMNGKLTPLAQIKNNDSNEHLLIFLDYFYEKRKSVSILLEEKMFKKKLYNSIVELIQTRLELKGEGKKDTVSEDIIAASLLGILMWWILDGNHYSSEYIAQQLMLLNIIY